MLFKYVITIHSDNHTKPINTERDEELLKVHVHSNTAYYNA